VGARGDAGNWLTFPLTLPVNALLWGLGGTNVALVLSWTMGLGVVVDLDGLLHRSVTRLGGIRIEAGDEDVALLSLPGEATHDVGLALKEQATRRGATRALVLGLCQDHIGYLASAREYRRGGYEAISTLFGEHTADSLLESQEDVLDALGWSRRERLSMDPGAGE
jgi:hypothetical protein